MAIGDKAAAAGLAVFPASQDLRLGYQNDNQRGDELADVLTDLTAKLDKAIVRIQLADPGTVPDGTVWISWAA